MDVGVEHGHLIAAQGLVVYLLDESGRVALRLGLDGVPLVHRGLVLGHDEVGHIQALKAVVALAPAHGELLHIEAGVLLGEGHHAVELGIDFRHGMEIVVGGDFQRRRAQGRAVQGGCEVEVSAYVQIGAAVGVGDAGIYGPGLGVAVLDVKVGVGVKGGGQIHLTVRRLGGALHIGEEGGGPVGAQPAVQRPALVLVGVEPGVQVFPGAVPVQGPDHGLGGLQGLGLGHVHGNHGLEGAGSGEIDDISAAVAGGVFKGACGNGSGDGDGGLLGGRREDGQRQAHGQGQYQRQPLLGGLNGVFHGGSPFLHTVLQDTQE